MERRPAIAPEAPFAPRTLNLSEDASKLAALFDSAPCQEAAMNGMNSRPTVARYGDNARKR